MYIKLQLEKIPQNYEFFYIYLTFFFLFLFLKKKLKKMIIKTKTKMMKPPLKKNEIVKNKFD